MSISYISALLSLLLLRHQISWCSRSDCFLTELQKKSVSCCRHCQLKVSFILSLLHSDPEPTAFSFCCSSVCDLLHSRFIFTRANMKVSRARASKISLNDLIHNDQKNYRITVPRNEDFHTANWEWTEECQHGVSGL